MHSPEPLSQVPRPEHSAGKCASPCRARTGATSRPVIASITGLPLPAAGARSLTSTSDQGTCVLPPTAPSWFRSPSGPSATLGADGHRRIEQSAPPKPRSQVHASLSPQAPCPLQYEGHDARESASSAASPTSSALCLSIWQPAPRTTWPRPTQRRKPLARPRNRPFRPQSLPAATQPDLPAPDATCSGAEGVLRRQRSGQPDSGIVLCNPCVAPPLPAALGALRPALLGTRAVPIVWLVPAAGGGPTQGSATPALNTRARRRTGVRSVLPDRARDAVVVLCMCDGLYRACRGSSGCGGGKTRTEGGRGFGSRR